MSYKPLNQNLNTTDSPSFVDGSFTGNLDTEVGGSNRIFNLGSDGDTDTEYLETSFVANEVIIESKKTGAGVTRTMSINVENSYIEISPFLTTHRTNGENVLRSSGTASTYIYSFSGGTIFDFGDDVFSPFSSNVDLGSTTNRWATTYSVDGSFSGNLINEVGGSYNLYNLGAEGDADTEYLEIAVESNRFSICPKTTGAGVLRELILGTTTDTITTKFHGTLIPYDSNSNISMSGSVIEFGSKAGFRHNTGSASDAGGCLEVVERFSSGVGRQWWAYDGSIHFLGDGVTEPCDVKFNITNTSAGETDYERVRFSYSGTKAQLFSEAGGTGTSREFRIGTSGGYQVFLGTAGQGSALGYNGIPTAYWTTDALRPYGAGKDLGARSPNPDSWALVGAVDGSFSGTLDVEVGGSIRQYGLGTEGDTDTEFLNIAWDTNTYYIEPKQTGSGANRNLNILAGNRTAGIKVKTNAAEMVASSALVVLSASAFSTNRLFLPTTNGTIACGATTNRWSDVYSVDGSFSGNLNSEVGGSYKLYNLGTDGDADTEYLEIYHNGSDFVLDSKATGTGTAQSVSIGRSGAMSVIHSGSGGSKFRSIIPQVTGTYSCGILSLRWANVFSVDGDFSGSLTTAGLTTGIQTVTIASDTLVDTDHTTLCDCTSNAITINLPTAVAGLRYEIKKIDASANAVTIDGNASETIDGALTATLTTQYESITIVSDGTNWFIVD